MSTAAFNANLICSAGSDCTSFDHRQAPSGLAVLIICPCFSRLFSSVSLLTSSTCWVSLLTADANDFLFRFGSSAQACLWSYMYSLLCQNHLSHSPEGEIVCLDRLIQMVAHLLLTWFKVHPAFLSVELCTSSGASTRRCSIASICSEVQRCISRAIDEVSETLHCSRKAEFSFGFFCPENVGIGQSPHPAIVNFLDSQPCNLRCPLTHGRPCLPDSSLVWFSEVGSRVVLGMHAIVTYCELILG